MDGAVWLLHDKMILRAEGDILQLQIEYSPRLE